MLCNKQDGESYGIVFNELFNNVTKKFPDFDNGKNLKMILVDFDDAQANGLKRAIGEATAEKLLRGCQVHWARSLQRVAKLVTKSKEELDIFLSLGKQIPKLDSCDEVKKMFEILSGKRRLIEQNYLNEQLTTLAQQIDTDNWKRLKGWSEWWCRPNHLKMFTKAYTLFVG